MKKFYMIENTKKQGVAETAKQIKKYFESHGAACITDREGSMESDTECVITLGGDGTMIKAARTVSKKGIPLIGINMGNLGYLTQVSKEKDAEYALSALLSDDFSIEKRMMLMGKTYNGGKESSENIALNEIVITRKEFLKVINFRIYVNDEFLYEYTADGIIIATPTGSTAYNLSAGGPIVEPTASMMIITPICAHALNGRSIVISADSSVKVMMSGGDDRGQVVVCDGEIVSSLSDNDYIEIGRADIDTKLIKLEKISFLNNLRDKMDQRR